MTNKEQQLIDEIRILKSMSDFVDNSEGNKQMNKVFSLIKKEARKEMIEDEIKFLKNLHTYDWCKKVKERLSELPHPKS